MFFSADMIEEAYRGICQKYELWDDNFTDLEGEDIAAILSPLEPLERMIVTAYIFDSIIEENNALKEKMSVVA